MKHSNNIIQRFIFSKPYADRKKGEIEIFEGVVDDKYPLIYRIQHDSTCDHWDWESLQELLKDEVIIKF
jgi:hypothetical protein